MDNVDESLAFLHETILRCCASAIRRVDREPRSKRDAEILIAKYALGVEKQTLEEIAKARGGVSREVIRQQERQALEHLRASDFLKSDAVRAHLAWLIFNDGLILPGTGLPAVTLELLLLLEDTHPGKFELSCHDGNAVVATLPWPLHQTAAAFENFEQSYVRSGVEFATQKLLEYIPFSPETAQFRRFADQLERWAEAQDAVLVTGRRTTLVRAALAKIGGTSHFTTIAREAATIANESCTVAYEHNVHSALRLYTDVFARPGGRGMYALVADGIANTDGLAEEMRKILAGVNAWMSGQRIWQALPLGNRFTLPSVTMTAGQFPFFFRITSFGLIASAEKPAPGPATGAIAAVVTYLASVRSTSRDALHRGVSATMTADEIDAVLACEQRILRIGSPRARSYLCYPPTDQGTGAYETRVTRSPQSGSRPRDARSCGDVRDGYVWRRYECGPNA